MPDCPSIIVSCSVFDIKHKKGSCKPSKKYKGDVFSIGVKRFDVFSIITSLIGKNKEFTETKSAIWVYSGSVSYEAQKTTP